MKLALPGGEATLVSLEGERVQLDSSVPSAPGTPLLATLDDGSAVRIKVARCAREGERFVIEGRLLDATRALRLRLTSGSTPWR